MSSYADTVLETIEVAAPLHEGDTQALLVDDWTLAFHLGFTGRSLWYAVRERDSMYTVFTKPKASGGVRTLHNPNGFMRVLGTQLRQKLLLPLCAKLGPHVTAYRVGQGTVDAARRHLAECATCASADRADHTCWFESDTTGHVRKMNAAHCTPCAPVPVHTCPRRGVKIHMDLSDFFGSTKRSWIRQYFNQELGYNHYVSSLLAQLLTVTFKGGGGVGRDRHGVPQGGKASGDITNLVADVRIDRPMLAMLPPGWTYSRYADDLYFTHHDNLSYADTNQFIQKIRNVIHASGYRVNNKKTHIQRAHKQQRLLGVVLNRKINIPRQDYRNFRAMLHRCWCVGFEPVAAKLDHANGPLLQGWIEGKLAYFTAVSPQRAKELTHRYRMAKDKYPPGSELSFAFAPVTP